MKRVTKIEIKILYISDQKSRTGQLCSISYDSKSLKYMLLERPINTRRFNSHLSPLAMINELGQLRWSSQLAPHAAVKYVRTVRIP